MESTKIEENYSSTLSRILVIKQSKICLYNRILANNLPIRLPMAFKTAVLQLCILKRDETLIYEADFSSIHMVKVCQIVKNSIF